MKQRIVALGARPEFWLACLLAWLLLSACRSLGTPWAIAALTEALRWGAGIGVMLMLGATLRRVNTAARTAAVVAGIMALAGVWDGFQTEQGGVVGPYHDHQLYGSVLLILLPIPVALALSSREALWRRGATAIAAACAVCLVLSETRSAWAGLLAATLVFSCLWLYRSGQAFRQGRMAALPALVLLGGVALLWMLTGPADLRGLVAHRAATLSTLQTDTSWQERLTAWRGAARMTAAQPLAGRGLGRYPGAQSAWTHIGRSLLPTTRPSLSEQAHSFYLQTTAEIGLIGLGFYLAALTIFAGQCLRRLRQARGQRMSRRDALLVAILSLMAGQAIDAIASPSWQFAEASLFFWALLGLGLAALQREQSESHVRRPALPLRRPWRLATSSGAAVVMASNFLPVGLLSPVEAYTSSGETPGTFVLRSVPALPHMGNSDDAHAGDTVYYQLTATNSATGKTDNLTLDPATTFVAIDTSNGVNYSGFSPNPVSGSEAFTVPSQTAGRNITIKATFYSNKSYVTLQVYSN